MDPEATITTKVINGTNKKDVDATADKFCVYKIADKDKQQISITATKGDSTTTKVYKLTGLTLSPKV